MGLEGPGFLGTHQRRMLEKLLILLGRKLPYPSVSVVVFLLKTVFS